MFSIKYFLLYHISTIIGSTKTNLQDQHVNLNYVQFYFMEIQENL